MSLQTLGFIWALICFICTSLADDRYSCCMGGWKEIRGMVLCHMPCCHGFEEKPLQMPLLENPVICQKLSEQELKDRRELATTTPIPPSESPEAKLLKSYHLPAAFRGMVDDQPNTKTRIMNTGKVSPSDLQLFLYSHRHLFVAFMKDGYTIKQLLAIFEKYLNNLVKSADKNHTNVLVEILADRVKKNYY